MKKADETSIPGDVRHVGLPVNEPSDGIGVPFNKSSDHLQNGFFLCLDLYRCQRGRQAGNLAGAGKG
jgi:hypothetical protein